MKKIWMCFVLIILLSLGTYAENERSISALKIKADGSLIPYSEVTGYPVFDSNGRTLVPLRATFEYMQFDVGWDAENSLAVIGKWDVEVKVPIGSKYVIFENKVVETDTAAQIIDGKTYVPLRHVLELLGIDVQ